MPEQALQERLPFQVALPVPMSTPQEALCGAELQVPGESRNGLLGSKTGLLGPLALPLVVGGCAAPTWGATGWIYCLQRRCLPG